MGMAIQITTNSQEAAARHTAMREEEEAKGFLEQQRLENLAKSEESKKKLLELQAQALNIKFEQEMKILKAKQEAELAHSKALMEMEVTKKKQLAAIESNKFKNMIDAIGQDTITNIARAGPEMQAKLLSGLGIKSMMITDGKSPINLFQTAQQMIAQPGSSSNNNVMGMMANMQQQQQQQSVDNVDE